MQHSRRPSVYPTPYPTIETQPPTYRPTGPTQFPTPRPTGPTLSPTEAPTTSPPTVAPTKYFSPRPSPGKPTLRPTTNAPSLQPTSGSNYEVKQFSYVADRVVVSMISASFLVLIVLLGIQGYRYFGADKISWDVASQWIIDKFHPKPPAEKKRQKRTLKKQHEDYWNDESEDQRKNFPLRSTRTFGGIDSSTTSVNSNTSMLYSVNLDDDNWDESTNGTEYFSVHSQADISLVNRKL